MYMYTGMNMFPPLNRHCAHTSYQVPGSVISDSTHVSQTIEVPATNILETGLSCNEFFSVI